MKCQPESFELLQLLGLFIYLMFCGWCEVFEILYLVQLFCWNPGMNHFSSKSLLSGLYGDTQKVNRVQTFILPFTLLVVCFFTVFDFNFVRALHYSAVITLRQCPTFASHNFILLFKTRNKIHKVRHIRFENWTFWERWLYAEKQVQC